MAEPNRVGEMVVFARVVEAGDFSGAARSLGVSPSAVSKLIGRLEERLGARLIRRSTRRVGLTPEGEAFHARTLTILADIDAAEREARGARLPAGRVRLNSSASYVTHILAPILPEFFAQFPDISLDITQTDALADLVGERTDIAIRAGPLADSSLVARSLGETALVLAAAPSWIARHCLPTTPQDLAKHDFVGFAYPRSAGAWLRQSGAPMDRVRISDGEGMRQLALAGVAPARLAHFTIRDDIAAGRLLSLPTFGTDVKTEAFHAIYIGRPNMLPERVRVLIDHLARHGMVT